LSDSQLDVLSATIGGMKKLVPLAFALLAMMGLTAVALAGSNKTFTIALNGKQESPKGDPNGHGTARITLEQSKGEVCFRLGWHAISKPVASHIHLGKKGTSGPVLVPLFAGTAKRTGCVKASKSLISKIAKHPANYYVNVHTRQFPGGAIRGQL
jgi:hypothetical protein